MRDLIEAAERAVAVMTGGTWTANDGGYSTDAAGGFIEPAHGIAPDDAGICALRNLAAHPDFFPALKLFADLKAKDDDLLARISDAINDSLDVDWRPKDGARAIMQELTK